MRKAVIDCTPVKDELGMTVIPLAAIADLTAAEQAAYDSLQLVPRPTAKVSSCAGRVALSLLDGTSKVVAFPTTMRSADYVVTLQPTGSLAVSLWTSVHTVSGFTLNLSAAIQGTIEYIAHEVL